MKKKLSIVLCILWMGFIFYNSSQSGYESNEKSKNVLNIIKEYKEDTLDMLRKIMNSKNKSSLENQYATDLNQYAYAIDLNQEVITVNQDAIILNQDDIDVRSNTEVRTNINGISENIVKSELASNITNKQMSINRKTIKNYLIKIQNKIKYFVNKHFNNFNVFIRKFAHAFEFLILALLLCFAMFSHGIKGKKGSIYTLIIVLLYAMSDEFHQLFVPGRGASIKDVIIDFSGGVIGVIIFYCCYYTVRHFTLKRKKKYAESLN